MSRTRRLQPVVQHTDKQEQRALQELAQSQASYESEQQRLKQLQAYRSEYLQQQKYDLGVFSPVELQDFNRFMQQLDSTIDRQAEVVELRRRELEQKRLSWRHRRIDAKVLHNAVARLRQQEQREEDRREQKILDEFAARRGC